MYRINSDELNDVICSYAIDFIDDKNIHVCIDGKFARATKENNDYSWLSEPGIIIQ